MSRASRVVTAVLMSALVTFAATSCSVPTGTTPESSTAVDPQAENVQALLDYVEAERAMIPEILAQYPGLYSDVSIEGSLEESAGDQGLAAGTYSVVWFEYTYANPMDWTTTIANLDGQRAAIDDLCATALFPAMRNAGITGPLSAVYSYGDGGSQFGPMWTHTCSDS